MWWKVIRIVSVAHSSRKAITLLLRFQQFPRTSSAILPSTFGFPDVLSDHLFCWCTPFFFTCYHISYHIYKYYFSGFTQIFCFSCLVLRNSLFFFLLSFSFFSVLLYWREHRFTNRYLCSGD